MQILDGKALAAKIRKKAADDVAALKNKGVTPGLAVVLVGDNPASHTYVKMKEKACEETGIYSIVHKMPNDISEEKILETIKMMNENPNIDGILIQLPLPPHIDTPKVLQTVSPNKDVDGFHPFNVGNLVLDMWTASSPVHRLVS